MGRGQSPRLRRLIVAHDQCTASILFYDGLQEGISRYEEGGGRRRLITPHIGNDEREEEEEDASVDVEDAVTTAT